MHQVIGAPTEAFELLSTGDWHFWPLGTDGAVGIKPLPDRDGDGLAVALPFKREVGAYKAFLRVVNDHLKSGRNLYSMAWKGHVLAINANQRIGGEVLGIDAEGYIHFRHTWQSFEQATHWEHHYGRQKYTESA